MNTKSLSHTKWRCKYHIVFAPKYRRRIIYGKLRGDIGKILRQLCLRKNVEIKEVIKKYIREQLQEDMVTEQLTLKELVDPFTGQENK